LTAQRTVTVDTTPPAVTINTPTNTTYSTSSQVINVTSTDTTLTVDVVIAEINNTENVTLVKDGTSDDYTYTYSFSEGQNNITIHSNDTLNNMNNTEIIYFTIDTTPPAVTITAPTPFLNTSSATNLLNATVTDATSGVDTGSVYYIFENSTGSRMNESGAADVWTNIPLDASGYYNTTFSAEAGLADGDYAIFIKANDSIDIGADNQNSTEFVNITIDNTAPTAGSE
jgi:hypothetical protein